MHRPEDFAARLLRWFDDHGRKDLPWQSPRTAYRVWLSEVMLQQTQVVTVVPYFLRFVEKFASLSELAAAPLDDVLAAWSGLGYYSRARNLHAAAKYCVANFAGELPADFDPLCALPGIGRSTAGAILAQAHGQRFAILDGNVKRVLARHEGVAGWPGSVTVQKQLWSIAEAHTPHSRLADYTQAIMDLGATICTRARPKCAQCPVSSDCVALRDHATHRLPEPKPRRAIPTRSTLMLIVRDAYGRLLLRRRPPTGVWAQLWSLPEAFDIGAATRDIESIEARRDRTIVFEPMPAFTHTFSHYRLDITPLRVDQIHVKTHAADAQDSRWATLDEARHLGLPAPVRKLLDDLEQEAR